MSMQARELCDKFAAVTALMHDISNAVAKEEIVWDGLDPGYVEGKFRALATTTGHVHGQIKRKIKSKEWENRERRSG
jgi:hypothetical protein